MNRIALIRSGCIAVAVTASTFAHATITTVASATAFVTGSQDTFNDLALNASVGSPLSRTANGLGYTITGYSAAGSQLTELYGAARYVSAGVYDTTQGALSTDFYTDTLGIAARAGSSIFSFGFTLYGGQADGSVIGGAFSVKVTNALSETLTGTFTTTGTTTFVGYTSTAPITSIAIANSSAGNASYITLDNLYLSSVQAVPEPSTYALMGLGILLIGGTARRRRR